MTLPSWTPQFHRGREGIDEGGQTMAVVWGRRQRKKRVDAERVDSDDLDKAVIEETMNYWVEFLDNGPRGVSVTSWCLAMAASRRLSAPGMFAYPHYPGLGCPPHSSFRSLLQYSIGHK